MKLQFQEYLQIFILAAIFTLPIIGFVFGIVRELKANVFGVVGIILSPFVGLVYSLSSVLNLGKVSLDEAGVNYANLRVWIVPTFILLSIILILFRIYIFKKI